MTTDSNASLLAQLGATSTPDVDSAVAIGIAAALTGTFPTSMPPKVREDFVGLATESKAEVMKYFLAADAAAPVAAAPTPAPLVETPEDTRTDEEMAPRKAGRPAKDLQKAEVMKIIVACATGGLTSQACGHYLELASLSIGK